MFSTAPLSIFIVVTIMLRVFENRILRRIFGSKRVENGERTRFHNVEILSLYRLRNIVRVTNSRRDGQVV